MSKLLVMEGNKPVLKTIKKPASKKAAPKQEKNSKPASKAITSAKGTNVVKKATTPKKITKPVPKSKKKGK
ncbi:MAG: hypothetical protein U1C51_07790 [Candidatus Izemoplasmatales bacterium]|nr:hypothetical protein [Candidatus Izemoplasmatales bacterium]